MRTTLLLLVISLITIISPAQKLEKIWSIQSGLITPESVLFDKDMEMIFVSNIGGEKDVKTSDGFISLMSADGEIENLKWLTGLNDPKGLAIWNNKLYVADMDELVVINIDHASPIKKFHDVNAKYLNDVVATSDGTIFVSDMQNHRIYSLVNDEFTVFIDDVRLENVNGLWAQNGKLYAGNSSLWEIEIDTKEMKELFTGAGGIDGLEKIGANSFIFTNWEGKIFISKGIELIKLLDTSEQKINTADIDYIPKTLTVLVPTFFGNSIDAYKLIME